MLKINILFVTVVSIVKISESYRILAIMPTPSYSHQIVFEPLWLQLNKRGHHITFFTTDPIRTENLMNFRQIDWSFTYDLWHGKHNVTDIIMNFSSNLMKCLIQYSEMMNDITEQELQHPQVQKIIQNKDEHFDVVIVEFLYPAMVAFSRRFNCPLIGLSPMDVTNFVHEVLGNPISPALYPDFISPFDSDMNFFGRIINTLYYLGSKIYFKYYLYPKADSTVRKYFGSDTPKLEDIQRNASIVFLNTNPIIHSIRPLKANVLAIGGGTHFGRSESLPPDIQKFLDEAEHGAIYFSLGTNVKSKDLPDNVKSVLLETFSELPYNILWKFEEDYKYTTSNIMMKKWLPQQQILKHPKIKVFITQGGLQSLEEAIYNAVPIIALPAYLDQFPNVRRVVRKGLGIMLEIDKTDKRMLKEAINEVVTNKTYKEIAMELSTVLKEQPISGLEQAIWWIEYVLKHKGARFLQQPQIPWFQYVLLDVLLSLLLAFSLTVFLIKHFLKLLVSFTKGRYKNKSVKLE